MGSYVIFIEMNGFPIELEVVEETTFVRNVCFTEPITSVQRPWTASDKFTGGFENPPRIKTGCNTLAEHE